jgi:thymidylate synthase
MDGITVKNKEYIMKNMPVLYTEKETIAEAYEAALVKLYEEGIRMPTQYDKPGDEPSIDSTSNITVLNPLKDPMIHKAFPGGIEDLREYVMELLGYKDHWVKDANVKEDTRWEYTYHKRLANWGSWKEMRTYSQNKPESIEAGDYNINQIELVVDKLCKQPFTRQAQMITWMPMLDMNVYDPPCLQSLWYRLLEDDDKILWLNCNIRIRSNDSWGAFFMNIFGLTQFNKILILDKLKEKMGRQIEMGRINWQADSWHIYGKDIPNFKGRLYNRIDSTSFEDRIFNFYDEDIQSIYNEAESVVLKKIRDYDNDFKNTVKN